MTDVSPNRTIAIGSTEYRLDGSFATLRAVQESFKTDVIELLIRIRDMRFDEIARLIAIATGKPDSVNDIGQAMQDEVGAIGRSYAILKNEVFAWLNIAMSPKTEREKKSAEMTAMLSLSRGTNTSGSPSDASAGSPANSGEATPGS